MKVYQINVVCGAGSTGRIAVDLGKAIEADGGAYRIAYGRGSAPIDVSSIKISNRLDLYVHAVMTRLTGRHGLYSKKATKQLIADIKEFHPDVIHLHNIHGYYLNYKMLFCFLKQYQKPVVWTMHDCWAFTGHCAHYDSIGCNKWKTECDDCVNVHAYPKAWTGKNVRNNFCEKRQVFGELDNLTIVTPSEWLQKQVKKSFFKDTRCVTIHNGIDLSVFKPTPNSKLRSKLGAEGRTLLLGVASVWPKTKGFDDFIRLRELLDENYVICMVGLTKKQIRGLPQGIVGIERTDSIEELVQYYSEADVFVNFTTEEVLGLVNIEANACGTPVITYRSGGSPECISEESGYVAEKGDLERVCDVIRELEREPKNKDACMTQATLFEKNAAYGKYLMLYRELLQKEE